MSSFLEEIVVLSACVGTALAVVRHTSKVKDDLKKEQARAASSYIAEVEKLINKKFKEYKALHDAEKSTKDAQVDAEIEKLYAELDRFIKKIVEIDHALNGREGLYVDIANAKKDIERLLKE